MSPLSTPSPSKLRLAKVDKGDRWKANNNRRLQGVQGDDDNRTGLADEFVSA